MECPEESLYTMPVNTKGSLGEETQQAIVIHLGQKKLIKKVMEEKQDMCKAMRDIMRESREQGIEQGIEQGTEQTLQMNIISLMKNMKWTVEQAMDALSVKNEQRERYRNLLKD